MFLTPTIRQLLVIGSCIMAAFSVGCSVGFPSVLLKQLASNESTIHLDLDAASWAGSIHGIAGVPSVIMPALMQWRGRKIIYIAACVASLIGWVIAYSAKNPASILISECFHGFGSHSLLAVALLSMSEMLSPRFRNATMPLYLVSQVIGTASVQLTGWYIDWRTLTLLTATPMCLAALIATMWTESPSWLAHKGKFEKCQKAFTRLRGESDTAKIELEESMTAQKENLLHDEAYCKKTTLKYLWCKLKCRDFYLPCFHVFILMCSLYWVGANVFIIYGPEIYQRATNSVDGGPFGSVMFNYAHLASCPITFFSNYLPRKRTLSIFSVFLVLCLLIASAINYSQGTGLISTTHVGFYILVIFMLFCMMSVPMVFSLAAEIMPVKHRGVGGPFYIIFSCVLQATSVKLAPYLFIYIHLWGTLLLYAVNGIICGIVIWKYVPETKGKTLQQLEDHYAYGNFYKHRRTDAQSVVHKLIM